MEAMLLRQFISTSPAELLISSIWQGLLLTALAWAALKLAPGLRASTRFTLWFITFLAVALLPCFALARAWFGVDSPARHELAAIRRWSATEHCLGFCARGCMGTGFPVLARSFALERPADESGAAQLRSCF